MVQEQYQEAMERAPMSAKPAIWIVDDLDANLQKFIQDHGEHFNVEPFLDPKDVLARLDTEKPDALVCDIFFYDTPEQAESVETQIRERAEDLRRFAHSIDADDDRYLAGIGLIEAIHGRFGAERTFPVYAYTSKGPYLLNGPALDRIERAKAAIMFKGRYSAPVERLRITEDIERFRRRRSFRARLTERFWPLLIVWGLASWGIGRLLEYLWSSAFI